MSAFKDWWNGADSPARRLPASTADLIEHIASDAFEAGRDAEHKLWDAREHGRTAEPFKF